MPARSQIARSSTEHGFAMVVVLLFVMAMTAGTLALVLPAMLETVAFDREQSTQRQLEAIHLAIVGDQRTTFGYFGDVGVYPEHLMDLVRPPADPADAPGWRGPYLQLPIGSTVTLHISGSSPDTPPNLRIPAGGIQDTQIIDAYGNPIEYYLDDEKWNNPDKLALVSRGPDGRSTYNPDVPQRFKFWEGIKPINDAYPADPRNADNLVFPALRSNNLERLTRHVRGTIEAQISNFDFNPAVNAAVAACPNLYTMTITSVPRGHLDVRTENVGQVTAPVTPVDLQQGAWTIRLDSPLAAAAIVEQAVTVTPNATLSLALQGVSINSAGTPTFTLGITNRFTASTDDLDVYVSGVKQAAVAFRNATTNYTVRACAPVELRRRNTTVVLDSFTMPYGISPFTKIVGASAVAFTVDNNFVNPEVRVYRNGNNTVPGEQIGQVGRMRLRTFTVMSGDFLTITNNAGAVVYGPVQITAPTTAVPGSPQS